MTIASTTVNARRDISQPTALVNTASGGCSTGPRSAFGDMNENDAANTAGSVLAAPAPRLAAATTGCADAATGCADAGLEAGVPPAHPAIIAVTVTARAMAVTRGPFLTYRILL